MSQQRRSFTPEFKQESVNLCRRSGKSECHLAQELGIPQQTFDRWMRHAAGHPKDPTAFWRPRSARSCAGKAGNSNVLQMVLR